MLNATQESKMRLLIVDDCTLFREGVKALLARSFDCEFVEDAGNGLEAVRHAIRHNPNLMLLDISMPKMNGISVIREVKKQLPETKILVLTIHRMEEYVLAAFEAGADGYCLKDADAAELVVAIKSINENRKYICPRISGNIMEGYLAEKKRLKTSTTWETLTQREREILKLVAEGYQNKEISEMLHISVKTVEKHRANIMGKTDLHSVSALTAYAIRYGLVEKDN